MQCFPSPGGNRVLTRASVSYLWCNVSPLLVVTVFLYLISGQCLLVSLLCFCLLSLVQCFPSPGGNRVLTRVTVLLSLLFLWCNVSPLLVVTVSLLVLLSLISGAMFPLSWW